MGLQKNVASQKWIVFAFDRTDNTPKTGDAANITANLRIDGGAANGVDDTNPTELEDGFYVFDLSQAETNGDLIVICPVSSTSNIQVIGVPGAVWTDSLTANQTTIINHLADVKGTGFVKDTDSLVDLAHTGADGDTLETLSDQLDVAQADLDDPSQYKGRSTKL